MLAVGGMLDKERPTASTPSRRSRSGYTQHRPFVAVYETNKRGVYIIRQRIRKQPYLAIFGERPTPAPPPPAGRSAPHRCSRCSS